MKKAFDVLQMRGIMEDDPYKKAFLQAGYFETAGVWIKRVGTQIILIQLMTDSIDLEINGKWDQAFWFADRSGQPACWTTHCLGIDETDSHEIMRDILFSENNNSRMFAGGILGIDIHNKTKEDGNITG